jgi:hypothetical protein
MTNCNRTYSNAGIQLSQIRKLKQSPGADNASHETESSFLKKGNPGPSCIWRYAQIWSWRYTQITRFGGFFGGDSIIILYAEISGGSLLLSADEYVLLQQGNTFPTVPMSDS